MKRVLALTAAVALVNASVAFAGDGLLASARRVARETAQTLARSHEADTSRLAARSTVAALSAARPAAPALAQAQQEPDLAAASMGRGKKILIAVAAAVGFAATAYSIDHHVEDNTPSSHGLRQD
jgi:hypothetical protein